MDNTGTIPANNQFICSNCSTFTSYLIERLCQKCYDIKYPKLFPCIQSEVNFNYECPDCKGRFNQPSYGQGYQSSLIPKCPWCGKEMKGI